MEQFGIGQTDYFGKIGTTSSLGNHDGHTDAQRAIFGIENWYGGKFEYMGGINVNNIRTTGPVYYIYDGFEPDKIPTVPYRTINIDSGIISIGGYISRLEWGDHADLIPIELSGASKYFYNDHSYLGD